jgi:hypothetical protein
MMVAVGVLALLVSRLPRKPAPLTVSGRVFDAVTKEPIRQFRVILGAKSSHTVMWQPHRIADFEGGRFDLPPDEQAWEQTWYRVEAEGYRPSVSRSVRSTEGVVALAFALLPDAGRTAVIRTPEGAPAVGAQAAWSTHSRFATARGATIHLAADERLGARVVTADAKGRLRFAPEWDAGLIIVAHTSGYAELSPAALAASPIVVLRKWCRVEGQWLVGTKPAASRPVRLYRGGYVNENPLCEWDARAVTDASGRFVCDQVVAGQLVIDPLFTEGGDEHSVHGLARTIAVRERQVTHVSLGGPGRPLVGRFEPPKDLGLPIDWSRVHVRLALRAPHIGFPGDDELLRIYGAFLESAEGKAYYRNGLPVGHDGSFRVEDVPAGEFQLFIWVAGPAVGRPDDAMDYAVGGKSFEVEPAPPDRPGEPMSLGSIVLRKRTH